MKIICKKFRDGTRQFEDGDVVSVPDADAHRFMAHGWAVEATPENLKEALFPSIPSGEVDLEIQDGVLGHSTDLGA